jgi:hypothetical protein
MQSMKKSFITLALLFSAASMACAKDSFMDDKPIAYNQLPAAAREFIKTHFADAKVALTTVENDLWSPNYEVIFTDGSKIEFLNSGEWDNIDCKYTRVPEAIVPAAILTYVKQNHPDNFVTEIDKERRGYEVGLNNHLDLTFSKSGQILGYDD